MNPKITKLVFGGAAAMAALVALSPEADAHRLAAFAGRAAPEGADVCFKENWGGVFFDACGATSTAPPGDYRCCANYSCVHGTLTPFELPLPVDSGGWYQPTFSVLDATTSNGSIAHAIACGSASVSIDQTPVSWTGNVFPPNPGPCTSGGACYTSFSAGWVNVPADGTLITACYMGAHEWAGTGACNDLIGAAWGGVSW